MNPAYDTWVISTHKGVNCLKCHADETVTGIVKAKVNGLREVALTVLRKDSKLNFNHQSHLESGASCTACHDRVVHAMPEQKKLDKKVCLECHQQTKGPVDNCTSCHKVVPKPKDHDSQWLLNHKKSVTVKGLESCKSCHKDNYCSKCHQ